MIYLFIIVSFAFSVVAESTPVKLSALVNEALENHPDIKSLEFKKSASNQMASATSSLPDPMIGISELDRGAKTQYWSIAQKFELPSKYSYREKIQNTNTDVLSQKLAQLKIDLSAKIISTYYSIYSVQRIRTLAVDDLQKIKEFSRVAESKYAAGSAPMQDSMKSHFLQTEVESELLKLRAEEENLQARMRFLLSKDSNFSLETLKEKEWIPLVDSRKYQDAVKHINSSPRLASIIMEREKADLEHKLSKWSYAPNFQVKYQGRLSGKPEKTHIVGLEMSIPLWFHGRAAGVKSAAHIKQSKEFELVSMKKNLESMSYGIKARVDSQLAMLKIFKTSLIPQALTTFDTSMDAYKANKVNFLSLLDAERSHLKAQTSFYRNLSAYIESVTELESLMGQEIIEYQIGFKGVRK